MYSCNSNFSLKYVLIDCVDVADVRQTFYNANQGRIQDLWLEGGVSKRGVWGPLNVPSGS